MDPSARSAYERVLRARKDRAARNRTLDSKRKKLRDDLEARERAARDEADSEVDAAQKLAAEIERLRKEGSKELERQNEELRRQLEKELSDSSPSRRTHTPPDASNYNLSDVNVYRLKAKWKKHAPLADENSVRKLFSRYGRILGLVVSRKGTSAIVEYGTRQEALNALNAAAAYDVNVELMEANANEACAPPTMQPTINVSNTTTTRPAFAAAAAVHAPMRESAEDDTDFENSVLLKLKRAQERKRLIESETGANQSEASS